MSRYQIKVLAATEGQQLEETVKGILIDQGFKAIKYKRENNVNRHGIGMLTAPKYIKYTINGNEIEFEAWIRIYGLLDSGVTGFVGGFPKRTLKKKLDELISKIEVK